MGVRLVIALLLLAAAPAFAQDADTPATLRPSIQADGPAPAKTKTPDQPAAAREAPPPPQTPAFSPIPPQPTPDQCRTQCAQDYYFCLADNEMQDCAPAWGQCRLACGTAAAPAMVR